MRDWLNDTLRTRAYERLSPNQSRSRFVRGYEVIRRFARRPDIEKCIR